MSWALVVIVLSTGVTYIPQRSQQTCEIAKQVMEAELVSLGSRYIFCVPMKAKELPEDLTP